jgi:hypothetical protein
MNNFRTTLLIFSILVAPLLLGQEADFGVLEGTVLKSKTTEPLGKVRVDVLTASGGPTNIATTTDDKGKFVFPKLRPGQYRLLASRQSYIRTEYGQRVTGGPGVVVALKAGQRLQDLRMEMIPGGVISGRVIDRGKPIGIGESPLVFALKATYELGHPVLTNVLSGRADDRGEYHIFWLPPGRYYVVVNINDAPGSQGATARTLTSIGTYLPNSSINGGARSVLMTAIGNRQIDTEMHVPMFHPGTPDFANAVVVDVGPGAEVRGVDIHADPVPALHVRGSVSGIPAGPDGVPLRTAINLYPENPSTPTAVSLSGPVLNVNPDTNGKFDKDMVSPGTYMLYASAGNRRARVRVEVRDRDANGVNVTLSAGATLSGRVVIEGANAPPNALATLRISLVNDPVVGGFRSNAMANAFTPPVTPAADGTFTIGPPPPALNNNLPVLLPGDYRVYVVPILNPAAGWAEPSGFPAIPPTPPALQNAYVKSIQIGDRNVLKDGLTVTDPAREPLVITVAMNGGTIAGHVLNEEKKPVGAAVVVLIPEDNLRFQMNHKFTSTDIDGRFDLKGIAPGDYKLFAWETAEPGSWQNPNFVREYESRGTSVRIQEDRNPEIEVKSIP